MQRRSFLRNTSLAAGVLALSPKLFARQGSDDPWKMKLLRNNVGIFVEKGGTIAYLSDTEDGSLVVDAQYPEQASHLIGEMRRFSDSPFRMLINTHHHVDHTAGNISFNNIVKNVAAHENSKAYQVKVAKEKNNEDKQLYPDITYKDEWHFKIGHENVKAYYWGAAHTSGDSIIHFEHANIVHMGDLVFYNIYPLFDKNAGASGTNWINVLDKTVNTFDNDTLFIFGHGEDDNITGKKEDVKGMQNYLQKLFDYTQEGIKAGKRKEDILKATEIPGVGAWKDQYRIIQANITIAYDELTAGK